jgi:hypothetical protein
MAHETHAPPSGYQGESLGGIVGALLGFEFDGAPALSAAAPSDDGQPFGLGREEVVALAASMPPGQAAEGFLTPEAVAAVAPELVAMAAELDALQGTAAAAPVD